MDRYPIDSCLRPLDKGWWPEMLVKIAGRPVVTRNIKTAVAIGRRVHRQRA
ncbi:hypothetical protein [Polaromonas sp. SM01]|uniref:hypothetical protein n=1 Tax=Polaromonas sp. SM01 TaxID=3085630 RepID=UPI002980DB8A|nr:hypothetical protein [Polaromonas sp. SM01]MDW5442183.1 hypothetical protein [Polaromonas sp. SM01]